MFNESDILIKGGTIFDGTGNPSFKKDISIINGKINTIGDFKKNIKNSLNVKGMIVSPGFIDIHNHADQGILAFPYADNYIMQGVTTCVVGNCGLSMAPVNLDNLIFLKRYLSPFLETGYNYKWNWKTLKEYFEEVKIQGTSVNIAPLVGQGTIRIAVKGFENSKTSKEEMKKMKKLLIQSLEDGAFGMSTGLIYPPGSYSTTEELIELASILKNYGALYASHIRNEGNKLIEAVKEAIKIGEENKIAVEISHHKAAGKVNWGKISTTLELMKKARLRGVDVNCDVYPYLAGMTTVTSLLPAWSLEGGIEKMLKRLENIKIKNVIKNNIIERNEWENVIQLVGWNNIIITECPLNKTYEGKSLGKILKEKNKFDKPYEGLFEWLLEIGGIATIIIFSMDESDVQKVISNPLSSICSDSWVTGPSGNGKPHPRAYGTFPRILRKYVIEDKVITLEEAIRKMTSLPASKIGLKKRGIIKEGFHADILIFDPNDIKDKATYANPRKYPEGIKYVFVNGRIVAENGKLTGVKSGKILKK
jgi:N-acyl-D-aspartate/D-glutamate deacylase